MNSRTVEAVQGEERNGFYVQPMMKRAWLAQLDVLKEIDTICKRHHIKYFAQWGTLLGAVREHGFIPWDDDMDLGMLRSDYERFQYYAKTELPEGCQIVKVEPTLLRVVNSLEICLKQEFLDKYHGCPYVMGVDLFAMDFLPEDEGEQELLVNLFEAVFHLCTHWDTFEEECEEQGNLGEDKWQQLGVIEELVGRPVDRLGSVKEQLCELGDQIAAMYWEMEYNDVTSVPYLARQPEHRIPRSCFDRIVEVPFEHTTIPILEDSDLLLRLEYGDDYMTPVRAKADHDYPFFKDQIKRLRDYFEEQGKVMPEFFDMVIEDEADE